MKKIISLLISASMLVATAVSVVADFNMGPYNCTVSVDSGSKLDGDTITCDENGFEFYFVGSDQSVDSFNVEIDMNPFAPGEVWTIEKISGGYTDVAASELAGGQVPNLDSYGLITVSKQDYVNKSYDGVNILKFKATPNSADFSDVTFTVKVSATDPAYDIFDDARALTYTVKYEAEDGSTEPETPTYPTYNTIPDTAEGLLANYKGKAYITKPLDLADMTDAKKTLAIKKTVGAGESAVVTDIPNNTKTVADILGLDPDSALPSNLVGKLLVTLIINDVNANYSIDWAN